MTATAGGLPGAEGWGRSGAAANVVGLIPAAGWGSRVAPLPCSKEIFPVAFPARAPTANGRVRVACDQLLDGMQEAGVVRVYFVVRDGKWDVPAFLGSGAGRAMSFAYVVTEPTAGVPSTLDRAYEFVRDLRVVCGFPDILLEPFDLFGPLLDRMEETAADVVLAAFPPGDPATEDVLEVDGEGRVTALQVKPGPKRMSYSWAAAAWGPAFTDLLHGFAREASAAEDESRPAGRHLGHALQAALEADLTIQSVVFPGGSYLDIGTPESLRRILGTRP